MNSAGSSPMSSYRCRYQIFLLWFAISQETWDCCKTFRTLPCKYVKQRSNSLSTQYKCRDYTSCPPCDTASQAGHAFLCLQRTNLSSTIEGGCPYIRSVLYHPEGHKSRAVLKAFRPSLTFQYNFKARSSYALIMISFTTFFVRI